MCPFTLEKRNLPIAQYIPDFAGVFVLDAAKVGI